MHPLGIYLSFDIYIERERDNILGQIYRPYSCRAYTIDLFRSPVITQYMPKCNKRN